MLIHDLKVNNEKEYYKLSDSDMETLLAEAKYRFSQGLEPGPKSFETADVLYNYVLKSFDGQSSSTLACLVIDKINIGKKKIDDEIESGVVSGKLNLRRRFEHFYEDIRQTLNDILIIDVVGTSVFVYEDHILGYFSTGCFGRGISHSFVTYDEIFRSFFIQKILEHFPEDETPSLLRLKVDRRSDSIIRSREEVQEKQNTVPFGLVYPGLPEPTVFWDNFSKATGRVTLLQGEGGTCKSSYIQHILNHRGWNKVFIADNEAVIARDDFVDFIRGSIPNGGVLIIEDGDRILTKREDGNTLMSAILNALSGIATKDIRIFITVNLKKLNNVDEALLRSGRMYRLLKFDRLSLENARKLREHLGDDPNDLTEVNGYTAGDVFNFNENNEKMEAHRNTLGFV